MLGDDRALSMAEIGVWYGNVSVHLLSEFPTLHMLLVDPYHLRSEGLVETRSCLHFRHKELDRCRRRSTTRPSGWGYM